VPVRHPDEEVRRIKPVEVIRADGVYQDQTNPAEAEAVGDLLEDLWSGAGGGGNQSESLLSTASRLTSSRRC
jgi:hypothetical protein